MVFITVLVKDESMTLHYRLTAAPYGRCLLCARYAGARALRGTGSPHTTLAPWLRANHLKYLKRIHVHSRDTEDTCNNNCIMNVGPEILYIQ